MPVVSASWHTKAPVLGMSVVLYGHLINCEWQSVSYCEQRRGPRIAERYSMRKGHSGLASRLATPLRNIPTSGVDALLLYLRTNDKFATVYDIKLWPNNRGGTRRSSVKELHLIILLIFDYYRVESNIGRKLLNRLLLFQFQMLFRGFFSNIQNDNFSLYDFIYLSNKIWFTQ